MSSPATAFRPRTLFQLTWPLFAFSLLTFGVTFADTALLSAHSWELAAVVSMGNLILDIPWEISAALAAGAMVLIARHLGRGDLESAHRLTWLALAANVLLNAGLAAILLTCGGLFTRWVNTPAEITTATLLYVQVIGGAMLFNGFLTAATAALRGFGRTVEILVLGILSNAAYLFLEYALIFGRWGFPELGMAGAAWSSFIVRGLGVLVITLVLIGRMGLRWPRDLWHWPCRDWLREMAQLSFPSLGESIAFKLHTTFMVSSLATIGTTAVLTRSYTLTITAILSLVPYVVSQGNDVLAGYDIGASRPRDARRRTHRAALGSGLATTLMAALMLVYSDPLVGFFSRDAAILEGVRTLLAITLLMQPFQAAATLYYNALRVAGDVAVPVSLSLACTWLAAFPLAWFGMQHLGLGPTGLWLAMAAAEVLRGISLAWRWHLMGWARR